MGEEYNTGSVSLLQGCTVTGILCKYLPSTSFFFLLQWGFVRRIPVNCVGKFPLGRYCAVRASDLRREGAASAALARLNSSNAGVVCAMFGTVRHHRPLRVSIGGREDCGTWQQGPNAFAASHRRNKPILVLVMPPDAAAWLHDQSSNRSCES